MKYSVYFCTSAHVMTIHIGDLSWFLCALVSKFCVRAVLLAVNLAFLSVFLGGSW